MLILALGAAIYAGYVYPHEPDTLGRYAVAILLSALLASILFHDLGVYDGDFIFRRTLRANRVIAAWAVTGAVLLAVAFALKISDQYSRVWALGWFAAGTAGLALGRIALGGWILRQGARGRFANRTAIIGTGPQAMRLAEHLRTCDAMRTRLLGFIHVPEGDPATPCPTVRDQGADLGTLDDLERLIRAERVDQVLIALPWHQAELIESVVARLATTPVMVRLAPDLVGFTYRGKAFAEMAGLPVLHLFERPISEWAYYLKTFEDRTLAILGLALFGLPMLLIALAVRLDSPGPVLFRQQRQGFNNTTIEVWKFRTMYEDACDPQARRLTTRDDPRVTRVGRFLRRTSLDELPQLFNVLRGEMSIVGPRPHAPAATAGGRVYAEVVERYAARHRVKPGITGWAQVNGWRGETDTEEKLRKRVEHDLYYIDHWSIWFDLWIIVRTLAVPFSHRNAY
ncbi:MAG: undecaprenyl-phosphate glucose phosphotransferase [Alphaproteobacteria bacterium]|nr:MAG: undecaprenyl-phosphate glucose phosphotransferase [Alphaproteobacteria bacterium]